MWPVELGGTGANTAAGALAALGLPYEVGTWTPTLCSVTGEAPEFTLTGGAAITGSYVRLGGIIYVECACSAGNVPETGMTVTVGTKGTAAISGLPFSMQGIVGVGNGGGLSFFITSGSVAPFTRTSIEVNRISLHDYSTGNYGWKPGYYLHGWVVMAIGRLL